MAFIQVKLLPAPVAKTLAALEQHSMLLLGVRGLKIDASDAALPFNTPLASWLMQQD